MLRATDMAGMEQSGRGREGIMRGRDEEQARSVLRVSIEARMVVAL